MMKKLGLTVGALLMIVGYAMFEPAGRVVRVACQRVDSSVLATCSVSEYFLGLFKAQPTQTVSEIKALSYEGRNEKDFFLLKRFNQQRSIPIPINRAAQANENHWRLYDFLRMGGEPTVDVTFKNEAGNLTGGLMIFLIGLVTIVFIQRRPS